MQAKTKRRLSRWKIALAIILIAGVLTIAKAWHDTTRTPLVRTVSVPFELLKDETAPIRIALLADIHIAGPDMPPERLTQIIEQVNGLSPDLVMVAGDFVSDKRTATRLYSVEAALRPFEELDRAIRKIAVPGNHDHWRDMERIRERLETLDFIVLTNDTYEFQGIQIGGLDDDFTGQADLASTLAKMPEQIGSAIILSHSPDPFPELPAGFGLMLAGHTHCGQIGWPWGGSPATMSKYGQRYACGIVQERGNILITSSGIGTSVLPFRLFTQPEIWLIELTGK